MTEISMLASPGSGILESDIDDSMQFMDFGNHAMGLQLDMMEFCLDPASNPVMTASTSGPMSQEECCFPTSNGLCSPEFPDSLPATGSVRTVREYQVGVTKAQGQAQMQAQDALSECSDESSDDFTNPTPTSNLEASKTSGLAEKTLTVHVECSSHQFEGVMNNLSKGINDMMIAGDIKNVRYSVQ